MKLNQPQPRGFNSPFNWRILAAILLLWLILGTFMRVGGVRSLEISYSKFKHHLAQDNISEVPCAAYESTPPRHLLISLILTKNPPF